MTHVDDFIDDFRNPNTYARFVLHLFRLNAALKADFKPHIDRLKLFCIYQGKRYRVTGASTMGDIWLQSNFNQTSGYELRVDIQDCTRWGDHP